MLYLKALSLNDGEDIYNFLQEIDLNDNGFTNPVNDMTFEEYKLWHAKEYNYDRGINMEAWRVPQSSYWLYCGEQPVGYGRLRHKLNFALIDGSGHIGYAVARSKRGLGYGNELLRLLLLECDKLNISKVQISAHSDNIPSNKIIIKHGGTIIRENNMNNTYIINR